MIKWHGLKIAFSGDIGRYDDSLMPDPVTPPGADFLLMESTYGDRRHDRRDPEDILAAIINDVTHRGGTVVIPAFAVGRAQALLFHVARLKAAKRVSRLLPVFLDSPMAIEATDIFRRHGADHRLTPDQLRMLDGDIVDLQFDDRRLLTHVPPFLWLSKGCAVRPAMIRIKGI